MLCLLVSSSLESFFELIGVTLIFLFVIAACYFATWYLGNFQRKTMKNKNLKVMEAINVAPNKMVSIVKAGTKYLVIAVGKEEINLLTELTEEELTDLSALTDKENQYTSFQDVFAKVKDKLPRKQDENE